jgi:uncharacterized protein (DUF1800 family)
MALTLEAAQKARLAFQRFGLGARLGGPAAIGADPKAALLAELDIPDIAAIAPTGLPTYAAACREGTFDLQRAEAVRRKEVDARVDKHLSVRIGFVERLVIFWSNHFSMSTTKSWIVRSTIGQMERDVIRAHVLGNFSDMLLGVVKHPAMISYLDNTTSVGPGSVLGLRSSLGFNENLARELMELHTLGSTGGQREADIRALTKMLTGWSFVRGFEADEGRNGGTQQNRGQFIYRPDWHEPDPIAMMGKIYPDTGMGQAQSAILDLAKKPATAELIAFKLVQHFITDEPTPEMVAPLKTAFLQTGGNLKAVATALLNLPEAWYTPLAKIRTPYELAIAQFRALGYRYIDAEFWAFGSSLRALQMPLWECRLPTGYSDETLHWLTPDGMIQRLDTARLAGWYYGARYGGNVPALARNLYSKALSLATAERIAGAGDRRNQLTMLFASPEFQRR